jgi:hypothetical protein
MKGLRGIAIAAGLAVLALTAAAIVLTPAALDAILTGALRAQGFENPRLDVVAVSPGGAAIADLRAGADPGDPDVSIARVDATFDLGELLGRRRLRSVSVLGPAKIRLVVGSDSAVGVSGFRWRPSGGGTGGGAPFDRLAIERLDFEIAAPNAAVSGGASGSLDAAEGGRLALDLRGAAGFGAIRAEDLKLALRAELAADGGLEAVAEGAAGLAGSGFSFPATALEIAAAGKGWRAIFGAPASEVALAARIDLDAAQAPVDANPLIAGFLSAAPDAERRLAASADLRLTYEDGALAFAFADAVGARITDGEGALALAALGAEPAFLMDGGARRIALLARVSGADVGGEARLRAAAAPGARWSFESDGAFGEQALRDYALGETFFSVEGKADAKGFDADAVVSTIVKSAKIGRLTISDAPVVARAAMIGDFAAKTLDVASHLEECVRIARARLNLEGQSSEARLGDALFCRGDGPLVAARWGDDPQADIVGRLTAATGSYRIGVTTFEGAPPALDVVASYEPDRRLTVADAAVSGGRVVINGAIVAADAAGRISGRLDGETMSGAARLDRVILAQNVKTLTIAPVAAAGTARLADEKVGFDYAARTLDGRPLGTGAGVHDLRTGRGETAFSSGDLEFARGGLQPAGLVLALRGIVGETVGAATARTTFQWGRTPADFRSSGAFSLKDVAFVGPGRAVTRTVGVDGDLALSSLSPLKSAGVQTVTVDRVDLDALQLENGVIRFSLPGDETLSVVEAEFPWFGGRIGAYDASSPLTGGDTRMELKAEDVDLGQMLAFVDVEGLSGEGKVEGVLPLVVREGRASLVAGRMSAKGPGVVRYQGKAAEAAAASNAQAKLAFDILRELHFDELTAEIDGPLDGALQFNVVFKGINEVAAGRSKVPSPVIYRISIEAPLLALLDQARVSTDFRLQFDRLQKEAEGEP